MTVALSVLMVALAGGFVAWPLLRESGASEARDPAEDVEMHRRALEHAKLEAMAAIRDAENDFHMGKLSDADLATTREKYERQALTAIAALNQLAPPPPTAASPAAAGAKFCPTCGGKLPPRSKFCPACGGTVAH